MHGSGTWGADCWAVGAVWSLGIEFEFNSLALKVLGLGSRPLREM